MDMIDDFYDDSRLAGYSPTTLKVYRDRLRAMPEECLTDLRKARRWLLDKQEAGLTPASVAGYVKALKAYSRWRSEEFGDEDVMAGLKFPRLPAAVPQRIALDEDLEAIRRYVHRSPAAMGKHARDWALVVTFAETGARRGEVLAMTLDDIDFEAETIIFPRTKGQRPRTVPMTPQLRKALRQWLRRRESHPGAATSDAVWLGTKGPLKPESITKIFRTLSDAAGLEHQLRPHQLRRRLASKWVRNGGADDTLMQIAGWRSPVMAGRYRAAHRAEIAAEQFKAIMAPPEEPTMTIKRGRRPKS